MNLFKIFKSDKTILAFFLAVDKIGGMEKEFKPSRPKLLSEL